MKKLFFFILIFLSACSKTELTPVGQSFESQLSQQKITLTLHNDGRFSGQFVNDYFGRYEIKGKEIKLVLEGSTMKIAPTPQLEAENRYFQDLKEIRSFILTKETLILKSKNLTYQFHPLNSDEMNIH